MTTTYYLYFLVQSDRPGKRWAEAARFEAVDMRDAIAQSTGHLFKQQQDPFGLQLLDRQLSEFETWQK